MTQFVRWLRLLCMREHAIAKRLRRDLKRIAQRAI